MKAEKKHRYGYRREVAIDFEKAVARVYETLKAEGFGVLAEIDMQEKFKEKLGVDFRRYVILGACNPPLAHEAVGSDLEVGLLLPCNVIVYENDGGAVVSAIDAERLLSVTGNEEMAPMAALVNEKLRRAVDAV